MGIPFMIFLAAIGTIVVFIIVSYNRLVSLTQRSQSAWSDVDVQLKRRTDLVPNLVESVKGYAAHERGTLDAVVKARGAAVAAQTPESRAQAEGQLSQALRGLFALAESYPDLKATANFQSLQASLGEIEDAVQNARRYFNAVVRDLNTAIQAFPSNLVAGFFQFRPHAYFELDRPDERQVPKVSFGA
jgi:LemA protein